MFNSFWSALASTFLLVPAAFAGAHCPGSIVGVHMRHIAGSLIVVPVEINHTGPYDFILDTGSQINMLDPRLASELHLRAEGTAGVDGVGFHSKTAYAHLDLIEIGLQSVARPVAYFQDISNLQASNPQIRGVLGGDILRHFDVLFDQDKNLLCLDAAGVLLRSIRGNRIPLATPPLGDGTGRTTEPLIVEAHVSRLTDRPLYLLIDSGANVPYLCDSLRGSTPSTGGTAMHIAGYSGRGRELVVLPAQDLQIGGRTVRQVSFVTAVDHSKVKMEVDGILPTGLFRSVYISYSGHFMVFEPW